VLNIQLQHLDERKRSCTSDMYLRFLVGTFTCACLNEVCVLNGTMYVCMHGCLDSIMYLCTHGCLDGTMYVCMHGCLDSIMYLCTHGCLDGTMYVCMHGCLDSIMYLCTHGCLDGTMYVCMHGCLDSIMYLCTHGCLDGTMYVCMHGCLDSIMYLFTHGCLDGTMYVCMHGCLDSIMYLCTHGCLDGTMYVCMHGCLDVPARIPSANRTHVPAFLACNSYRTLQAYSLQAGLPARLCLPRFHMYVHVSRCSCWTTCTGGGRSHGLRRKSQTSGLVKRTWTLATALFNVSDVLYSRRRRPVGCPHEECKRTGSTSACSTITCGWHCARG
jgi:hypothetical protein